METQDLMQSQNTEQESNSEFEILSREELLGIGEGLLLHRGYPWHLAKEIALDALYLCAKNYKEGKGANVQTYYNRCISWTCGHYTYRWKKLRRAINVGCGLDSVCPSDMSIWPDISIGIEIEQLMSILPKKHHRILKLVALEQYKMSDVAKLYKVSRARIGQLVAEAINIIRKSIEKDVFYNEFREEIRRSNG